ncbi:MAG: HAMP domain-containing histidine kinase [Ardenticatenaceae bacterium]|nr:HAMP domain-containing histidine kinase [Ardenticatenaceae bacterium]MCB8946928.1 HAMP domain-containing histidine kinase [Ardenticatenaceae bacterium]
MTNQNSDLDQLSAAELRQRLIAAQEENQKLNTIVATMVSELMTPLNVIREYAYLLLEEESAFYHPLDSEQAKAVDAMRKGAVRSNELLQATKKILTKADSLENLESSLVQNYHRQLQEANQQLAELRLKYQAKGEALQGARNEFVGALSLIVGYSQLFLKQPELIGGPLNSGQLEGITAIDNRARNLHEAIDYHFFDLLGRIDSVDAEPAPEAVALAEIGKMTEFEVESEFDLETAVSINRYEARSIINLLARGWFQRNKGSVLEVTAVSDDTLRFHFPHTIQIPSSRVKNFVDGETGRLKFTERQRYFDPISLATGLVEKYGGAVYAELTDESSCHLSFTLPIYQEES